MKNQPQKPTLNCYLADRRFWAGEYPGDVIPARARRKVKRIMLFGVDSFIDLTEPGELAPYLTYLPIDVFYDRFAIRDASVLKSAADMDLILDKLDERLDARKTVYLHCWGGIGRTGMVVACYYVRAKKLDAEEALRLLKTRFKENPKSRWADSPETPSQFDFIRNYAKERKG